MGEVGAAGKVLNLAKVLDSGPAPTVAIISHPPDSHSAADVAGVTAQILDAGKGIGRIEWRVNGITVAVASKADGKGPTYTFTRQLALDPGDNTIEVVAYNGCNLLASLPARTTVKFTGPADKTKPKLHILAIGINDYVDKGWAPPGRKAAGFGPLSLAVKDATAFAAAMKQAAAGMYDDVRVTLALDKDATRDNLHKLLDKVAAEIHPRDTFILFAAAHGKSENGRFHLIPQDYQHGPGHLQRHAIGQDDLQDWLANRIKARKAIILLDTCESGALIAGHTRSRIDAAITEAGVGRLHEATGRPVLTAAAADQEAAEGEIGATGERHGYFTWALLDALKQGRHQRQRPDRALRARRPRAGRRAQDRRPQESPWPLRHLRRRQAVRPLWLPRRGLRAGEAAAVVLELLLWDQLGRRNRACLDWVISNNALAEHSTLNRKCMQLSTRPKPPHTSVPD